MERYINHLNNVWDSECIFPPQATTHKQRKLDAKALVQGDEFHVFWNLPPESEQTHQQQV